MESFSIFFFYPEDVIRLHILFSDCHLSASLQKCATNFHLLSHQKKSDFFYFLLLSPSQYLTVLTNSEGTLTSWISMILLAISEDKLLIPQTWIEFYKGRNTKVNLNENENTNSHRVFRPQLQQGSDFVITLWKNLCSQEDVLLLSVSARPQLQIGQNAMQTG